MLSEAKSLSLIPELAKNRRLKIGGERSRGKKTGEGSKQNYVFILP